MGDTRHSPSSLFGDGEHTSDEDVWSPSLRRDVFSHSNAISRESRSPRQDILPSYLNLPNTGASTQQPSFNNPSPSLSRALHTFSPSRVPGDPSHPTPNAQNESGSSPESIELESPSPSISTISWNVLSSDSESGTRRMSNSARRQGRRPGDSAQHPNASQRTSSDFVDLTEETDTPPRARMPSASNHVGSNKRRRVESNASALSPQGSQRRKIESQHAVPPAVEEVDLRDVDDDKGLSKVLEDQRMATIKAQQEQASRPVKLATLSCVICMEPMTDVTATHCGHLFCHKCLMEALIAGENQGSEPGKGPSKCPVCRKKIKRPGTSKRDSGQVVALEIKIKRRNEKGKEKERRGSIRKQQGPSLRGKDPVLQNGWD